jgi:hypothetical protein
MEASKEKHLTKFLKKSYNDREPTSIEVVFITLSKGKLAMHDWSIIFERNY